MSANGQKPALRDHVASGAISLCPESGHQLIKVLQERIDDADSWLEYIDRMARPLLLGANPVAEAMSAKFADRAGGDSRDSLRSVISAYREVVAQTCDTITKAMRNLHESDGRQRDAFAKINAGADRR